MSPVELAEIFSLFREPDWPAPRYNIGPMQQVLAVRTRDGLRTADKMQWGLVPGWAKDARIGSQCFNARAETVSIKPAFRSAIKRRRCIIPASGFYEWQRLGRNGSEKQAWHFFLAAGGPLALAGLWESWKKPDGEILETCTVITTTANQFMSRVHDRMPVILDESVWNLWTDPGEIEPDALDDLLAPCPEEWLQRSPVSSVVNNVRNESPECIVPTASID